VAHPHKQDAAISKTSDWAKMASETRIMWFWTGCTFQRYLVSRSHNVAVQPPPPSRT